MTPGGTSTIRIASGNYCADGFHAYPQTYAGDPQNAEQYFNHCLCGKKRKVTTTEEVGA